MLSESAPRSRCVSRRPMSLERLYPAQSRATRRKLTALRIFTYRRFRSAKATWVLMNGERRDSAVPRAEDACLALRVTLPGPSERDQPLR